MTEFKYEAENGSRVFCDSCQCHAPIAKYDDRRLCELCACSEVGNATKYPDQFNNIRLFVAQSQIGNVMLDKLTDRMKDIVS